MKSKTILTLMLGLALLLAACAVPEDVGLENETEEFGNETEEVEEVSEESEEDVEEFDEILDENDEIVLEDVI
ncbi:MAG: hypothetical protein ACMXX6_01650 [Candidatus Woesearchaeota archaeon]